MIDIVAEIVKHNVTTEKVFLTSDMASAKFIQRQLAGIGGSFANLKFESASSFISRLSGFSLLDKNARILKPGESVLILQSLVRSDGYFAETLDMPGFMLALWQSIQQLRVAQIKSANLTPDVFGSEKKSEELSQLLKGYVEHLDANNLYDYTRVLKDCLFERALANSATLILLPGNLPLMPLELEVLKMAGNNLIHLPWSSFVDVKVPVRWRSEVRRPAVEAGSSSVCCLPGSARLELFCATEPTAEIREIVRRIRFEDADFEQVAIVPADPAIAPLICSQLDSAGIPHVNSLPRNINEFRPGRLALNLCQWASDDFPADGLIAMLNQGDLRLFRPVTKKQREAGKRSISSQTIIGCLRQAHVRGGRDGYRAPILAAGESMSGAGRPRKLRECRRIVKRIDALIAGFADKMTPGEAASSLLNLLSRHLRINSVDDSKRFAKIRKALQRYPEFTEPEMPLAKAMWWLQIVLSQLGEGETFAPDGRVLVTSPLAAAFSGRKMLFFPGMTHAAIPGKASVDPVVSDSCRKELPPLQTAAESRLESIGELYSAWAEIGRDKYVCISMPMIDADGTATSPSECFTRALKQKSGKSIEFSRLVGSSELPLVGHFVAGESTPLDLSEWLWRKLKEGFSANSLKNLFFSAYPLWNEYQKSQENRASLETPVCTGLPDWNQKLFDYRDNPDLALSASGIEELGGCQFAYFLNYVLNCMPSEQIDTSGQRQVAWLDSLARGKLLHEIYENFMIRAGWPVTEKHRPILEEVVDEIAERYRIIIPPSSFSAFIVSKASIRRDALEFFERECDAARNGDTRPIGFELSFGLPLSADTTSQSGLDSERPVAFTMASGNTVNLKGRLDRIDETADGIRIWDYKTGSARDYQPGGMRNDQALLQLAVYKYAVARILKDKNDGRKVTGAGLYFPTIAGQGQRIILDGCQEEEIINSRLEGLFEFLVDGRFPPGFLCESCNALNICPYVGMNSGAQAAAADEEQ